MKRKGYDHVSMLFPDLYYVSTDMLHSMIYTKACSGDISIWLCSVFPFFKNCFCSGGCTYHFSYVPAWILPSINKPEDAACVSCIDGTEDLSYNVFLLLDLSELKLESSLGLPLLRFATSKI